MGKLRGEGDLLVMELRRGECERAELAGCEELLQALEDVDAVEVVHDQRGDDDHRRVVEHVRARVREPGELRSRHGVAAHEGPVVSLRDREAVVADDALDADGVDDDGTGGDEVLLGLEPLDAHLGVAREDDELAGTDDVIRELAVNRLDHGELGRRMRAVPGEDLLAARVKGFGERAAHEAEAHDPDSAGSERAGALLRHVRPPRRGRPSRPRE